MTVRVMVGDDATCSVAVQSDFRLAFGVLPITMCMYATVIESAVKSQGVIPRRHDTLDGPVYAMS
jgi:hypothetical protein